MRTSPELDFYVKRARGRDGWDFGPGNMSIVFYGSACDKLQMGGITMVKAIFSWPPVG